MQAAGTLVILRHGTAEGHAATDFDRRLVHEGEAQAAAAGRWLARHVPPPDVVLASPASRAWDTARLACAAAGVPPDRLVAVPAIYEASAPALRAVLAAHAPSAHAGHVWLVGHNPGLEDLVGWLAQDEGFTLPTGTLAVFDVSGPWSKLAPTNAALRHSLRPADL